MIRRNKKGSLSLSINAIVVLILAITILGLGLGFIRNQFGAMNKRFDDVQREIQDELIDKIKTSGELLVFNIQDIQVKRGVEEKFYMGISNPSSTGTSRCFLVLFRCMQALGTTGGVCDTALTNPIGVGGDNTQSYDPSIITGWVNTLWFKAFPTVDIAGGDVGVYPITLQVAASPATYMVEVDVFMADADGPCAAAAFTLDATALPWQKKQFYVEVK